jgi:dienelactone hydrolase
MSVLSLKAWQFVGSIVWWAVAAAANAQERVTLPSLDRSGSGVPVELIGFWFRVNDGLTAAMPAPAVVLLHGCGGTYNGKGALSQRALDYAHLLNDHGMHALVLDSLTPRGEKELCTQRIGTRRVTQANRRLDALAAVEWIAHRPDVDARRIGLMGWSNGGSTVLAALSLRHADVAAASTRPAFAVAFYPGCESDLKRGFETRTHLLMLVGEADDWTPAAPCHELAHQARGISPEIEGYAGAFHGFDSATSVRLRRDVPNGANPGQGVHVGGNAAAWAASRERLLRFLAQPFASTR